MHFKLVDGRAVWAIASVQTEKGERYLFQESELADHPEHTLLEQPTAEVLARAVELEGRTFSRSEFERLLFEQTPDELLRQELADTKQQLTETQDALIELAALLTGGAE